MKPVSIRPMQLLSLAAMTAMSVCIMTCASAMTISAPTGDWVVGPIRAQSSSGVGYCSMKNDYDAGLSLVFARDAEGSNSIAIDFHQKRMKVGAQYVVGFKVGLIERKMVAIAATPSVLIVQMGLDRAYYETLRRKSVMQISLNGEDMAFSLNGTGDALASLTDCAVAVGKGKAFKQVRVAAGKVPPEKLAADVAAVMPDDNSAVLDATDPATKPKEEDFDLGKQAAEATLKKEIEDLKAENTRLLLQNQAIAERMAAEDGGHHPLAQPDPPEEIIDMPPKDAGGDMAAAGITADAPAPKDIHVKTSAAARASGKTHVLSATLTPEEEGAAPVVAAANVAAPVVEPSAGGSPVNPDVFLNNLLRRASIRPQPAGEGRYTWKTDGIYGGALEGPLPRGADFTAAVGNYLDQAKTRCGGDFARKMGAVKNLGGMPVQTGEIVCMDGKNDVGAALLFMQDGGNLIVVTHEGTTDQMDEALRKRSAILSNISN